jgi:protocatechuate 3,4-dioxygenase beta subunit
MIAGTRLAVSPESQTVPFNTPTIVETELIGFESADGPLPANLRVLADFTGPEIDGVLVLETVPGEPFRIPRLSLKGQYQLDNIRLVQGDDLLAYAEPRSAGVLVTQVLVTRVTSRPLTLDEIRSYGVVVGDESFQAFNFTFGFAVGGETFDYNLPVLYTPLGGGKLEILADMAQGGSGGSTGTTAPRFQPPQMAPFNLKLEPRGDGEPVPTGGCGDAEGDCFHDAPVTLPGVILFPTDVSLLHQFFSVVLLAKNDAPEGDALRIRDLAARVVLPPGLRMAKTEPPTPLGVPVPVRVPGADGRLGTGDDLTFLVAQAEGQAEVVVEGLKQGTHIVEFQIDGTLAGLPGNEVRRISGTARGAVVVRDPALSMTITHPDVVRADEPYTLRLTVANTAAAPVNLLSIALPPTGLSGVELAAGETNVKTIPTLLSGDAEVVEFHLVSRRTGKVTASSVRSASAIDPHFELVVGVGDAGIPLSPTALVLPKSTEELPELVVRHALSLLGLGWSLATAPASLATNLPRLGLEEVHEKVYWLGQAGRHVKLGEEPFDSLSVLALEWTGARDRDWEWDDLRRRTQKGGLWESEMGKALAGGGSTSLAVFDRFAATTAFLAKSQGALAVGNSATIEVSSRTSGKIVSGLGTDAGRRRELPFAALFRLDLGTDGQMVTLAVPEENGYRARLRVPGGGSADLHVLVPEADGTLRRASWTGVALSASGSAWADFKPSFLDSELVLEVDADGDGVAEDTRPATTIVSLSPRAFTALAAVQNELEPSAHMIEVLFTQDVDLRSLLPADPGRFKIPGKVSNGGLVPVEEDIANFFEVVAHNPFKGLRDTRIVRVIFDNPVSPLIDNDLTVRDLESVSGGTLSNVTLPVVTTVTDPGAKVQGTVYGPDGRPVPFARVELHETDFFYHYPTPCRQHKTAAVQADANGRYAFDYVRQTFCGDVFTVNGADPGSGKHGSSRARVRFVNQTQEVDIVMLGRGTIRGKVRYDNGDIPADVSVIAYSPVFFEGREARLGVDGTYEVGDVPVGTVTLGGNDGDGGYVFQTVEIPTAGAVVQRDLTIIRRPATRPVGDVRGTVVETDNVTPVYNAYLALYVNGELVGMKRSDSEGRFDFGTVPAGLAQIEAFDGETGLTGAQVTFDVEPDQVNEVPIRLRDDRGTVQGHVYVQTLSAVTPLAGAVVWVSGTPFNTVTDANGFYRLDGVFAGDRTILAADLVRNRQTSAVVSLTGNGQTVSRDLYFVESVGSGLTGEVVGFSGNPVPGATVHLSTGGDQWFGTAVTDAAGRFVFPNLSVGTYSVHAIKGQDGGVQQATIRFQGETPSIRIQFKKGAIRGVVRTRNESGQLVGVRSLVTYRTTVVRGEMVGLDWDAHTLETNADGTFELPNALVGRYVLTVSNAFHGEKTVRGELLFANQIAEHEFLFEPNGTIRGVVLDWDGVTPAAGTQVFLRHPSFSTYDLTTDAAGRFEFELVPPGGTFPIDATIHSGAISRQARVWVTFTRFGQELDVEIRLPRQGTVTGQVEDANGNPVPGAVVTMREHGFPQRQLIQNADNQGRFSFTNIFAGKVALTAKAPSLGGLGAHTSVEIVDEGEEVFALLSLEATGEITGRVLSPETGQPVATTQVSLHRDGGIYDVVTSDADGAFRFRLLPLGDYLVWVFDPRAGRHGRSATLKIQSNNQVVERDVVLEARGNVEGHLYEPNATAGIPGATISLQTRSLVPFHTFSSTDVDGRFEFQGIPEGTFTLSAKEPEGRRRASGEGAITEEDQNVTVDLFLEESGRVVGSVRTPVGVADGLFPNANTLIYQVGQVVGATLQNPFEFNGIIADRGFQMQAFEVGGDHRAAKAGQLTQQGEEVAVTLRMVPIGSVAVTVRDSFDNPVPGANVQVWNNGFYGQKGFTGTTGADGKVTFSGAGEGTLSVYATHPVTGLRGSGNGAIATEGQVAQVAVRLEDSGRIRGRAVKANGVDPAAGALVVLTRAGRTLQTLADVDGWFSFASVPLGPFTVFVQEHLGPGSIERGGTIAANGQEVDLGTLRLDNSDPYVVSLTPESNSRDLPLSTAVRIEFNEPLDRARFSGGWVTFRALGGAGVAFTLSWEAGDTVMKLTPNAPLASFTGYEVIVWDAYDLAGRRLSSRARTAFHTVDVLPPNVIDMLPRDGQSQVALDTLIKVTFSEPVTLASLSGNALQLTDLTTGLGITTTFLQLPGNREVLLTPAVALENNHRYQVRVQGVQDGGGNTMAQPVTTTFWTPDTIPPQIQEVLPAEGTAYTAGNRIPVAVSATDERGLGAATISYAGWTFTDAAAPYSWSVPAPVVSAPSDVPITVKVKDIFGNESTVVRTVHVNPRVNANPPQVGVGCAEDGDAVVPGIDAEFILDASDDEGIERYRFLVDGAVVQETSPVDAPTAQASFLWRPPASAAAGTSFLVRLEARDFAGNVGVRELTVSVPAGIILKGSQSLSLSRSGQALVLAGGTFLVRDRLPLASVTVLRGATLSAPDDNPEVELEVAGALELQCGATVRPGAGGNVWLMAASANVAPGALVDGSLRGYPAGGTPAGVQGPAGELGSGSHGGRGWPGAGVVYGSVVEPRLGGGGGVAGASGGGIVEIAAAGDLRVGGEIRALGGDGCHGGGAAGGSVLLRGATVRGNGLIDASGGRESLQCSWNGGLGGGGRVAVHGALNGFTAQVRAWGGAHRNGEFHAAPGTVYFQAPGQTQGVLVIDRGTTNGVDRKGEGTELPTLGTGAVASFSAAGGDAWVGRAGGFRDEWLGAWMVLLNSGGSEIGAFRVVAIDAQGRARLAGAGAVAGAASYRGEHRFDRIEMLHGAALTSASPIVAADLAVSGEAQLAGEVRAANVTIKAGAVLRPASGRELHFVVSGAMIVEAGARIDVSGLGYPPAAAPPGVTPAADYANGGTHGGVGGNGEIYDSVYEPSWPGAGGTGGVAPGKPGGGVVRIEAGSVQLDGEIRVRGVDTCGAEGGGAGGAVFIAAAGALSGAGLIDASGGAVQVNMNCSAGNAGGGGRVALQVGSFSGFDPAVQVKVQGGAGGPAGAGTLLTRIAGQTYGLLRVDQRATSGTFLRTGLATIGRGTVGATFPGADPADLWIEPQDTAVKLGLGVAGIWTRIDGVDYRVLELSADRRRILLEGAAGAVGVGQSYAGLYKFDSIQVAGRARLEMGDLVEVTGNTLIEAGASLSWLDGSEIADLELRGDSSLPAEVRAANVTIGSGATARPASGGELRFVVSGLMKVEAGAKIDVSSLGYSGALPGHADGYAPPGVPGATGPYAGGAHGGRGVFGTSTVFDSVYEPRLGGGGGAWGAWAGVAGGGVIRIEAGQLVLDGELRSSALSPCNAGGGAGGTVAVTAGAMSGTGSIDVSGSSEPPFNVCNFESGAGGGGRASLIVGSFTGFDPATQIKAWGGSRRYDPYTPHAAPGTVYYRLPAQQWGVLIIDNGQENGVNRVGPLTQLPALGSGSLATFEAAGADAWVSRSGGFAASWRGAWMVLRNAAGASLGAFRVADLDAQGRALLAGAGAVAGAASYAGEYRFDRIDVLHGSSYNASDPVSGAELVLEGDLQVASEIRGVDVRIKAGARIRPVTGSELRIIAAGKVTIEPGALLDLESRGYGIGAAPPGITPGSGWAQGGTHGGSGGNGDFYDSVYEPSWPGAGGTGGSASGKPGGGVVRIEAGSVQLDGEIRVRGAATCGGEGGGAGGAVYIKAAATLSGAGLIDATGGAVQVNANCNIGNPGGGGRVALHVGSFAGFDPALQVKIGGGNGDQIDDAGAGTLLTRTAEQTYGSLRVDQLATSGTRMATGLAVIGSGTIGATYPGTNAADLWIEPQNAAAKFGLGTTGAWTRINGVDYRILELSSDRRRILLEGASAAVAAGQAYAGVYKLDGITVAGRANLVLKDLVVVTGGTKVEGGSTLTTIDDSELGSVELKNDVWVKGRMRASSLTVRSGAVVRPASGNELRFIVSGTMTIEATALVGASALGYGPGGAPPGVTGASGYANGGTHGGWGGIGEFYDNLYEPWLPGAGGTAGASAGTSGGGVVYVEAGALVLNGQLRALGQDACGGGGGAGGAILVRVTGALSGSGSINANGGLAQAAGCGYAGNPGGGGRVALHVGSFSGFNPATQVYVQGGGVNTGPGTLLTRTPSQTYGSLRVDARATTGIYFGAELAKVGSGTVGATFAGPNAADLWIEPQGATVKFDLGVAGIWTRINGVDYRILELSSDRRRLLLQGAASTVSAGQSYIGVYKLDSLTVAGRGNLILKDLLVVTGATKVEGGSTLVAVDDSELGEVELAGDVYLKGRMRMANLVVRSGASVRPASGSEISLIVAGTMTVEATARVIMTAFGYGPGGAPAGVTGAFNYANGGTHGGWGGGGEFYDNLYEPRLAGGGGTAGAQAGTYGGGVLYVEAGALVLNGELRALGQDACGGGGGAGGAILVRVTGALSGSGSVNASGGLAQAPGCVQAGNPGGGGRVALHVGSFSGFNPATQVYVLGGGVYTGAGTLLTKTPSQTYGSLRVDARATTGVYYGTEMARVGSGTIGATFAGPNAADLWIEPQDPAVKFSLGVAGIWTRINGVDYKILELSSNRRRLLLQGAASAVSVGQSYIGVYKLDSLTVAGRGNLIFQDLIVVTGTTKIEGGSTLVAVDDSELGEVEFVGDVYVKSRMRMANLVVRSGAVVRPASGSEISLVVAGTMTVEGTARVGGGFGYGPGGAPAGVTGASNYANGGTHGGWGGFGEFYDSLYEPRLPGGGGTAGASAGSYGGPVLYVEAGALVLNGELRALGQDACGGGGGAGGAILVRVTGAMSGTGSVTANGGLPQASGCGYAGNPGGGGRVALHVGSFSGFNPTAQVYLQGGTGASGAGTLLTKTPAQTYGSLRVDQRASTSNAKETTPATIGRGIIAATYAGTNAADLWIEPQGSTVKFGLGVAGIWTRINGVDYKVLELSSDRRRLLLQGAAGAVAAGQRYVGIYKVDSVSVAGRARVEFKDGLVVTGATTVESGSTLILIDADPPAVNITEPAQGTVYTSGQNITVTATASDPSGIASVTFKLGSQTFTDTAAPYTWTVVAPSVAAETDMQIVVTALDVPTNEIAVARGIRVAPPAAPAPAPSRDAAALVLACPSAGALAAPGLGLDFHAVATRGEGIERVELLLGSNPAPVATDFDAPYTLRLTVPAHARPGQVLQVKLRAWRVDGTLMEIVRPVTVVGGEIVASDRTLSADDRSLDGKSVVVAGTLTLEGVHDFESLVVLDGATVTHPAASSLQAGVNGDLYVACGGAVDATGRGIPGKARPGGSHGGRGGFSSGRGPVLGNLFDPQTPGGGGVIRLTVLGDAIVDGAVVANGEPGPAGGGAGGSIRIDAATLAGAGRIQADGSRGADAGAGGGGGGRIALYATKLDAGLLERTSAAGAKTESEDPAGWGAAGTIFVQREADLLGELIVDNEGTAATQPTELPAVRSGVVDEVGELGFTDREAELAGSLRGMELVFNDDPGLCYMVDGHDRNTFTLQVPDPPLSSRVQPGDTYHGVYRFDRVTVRGGARVLLRGGTRLELRDSHEVGTWNVDPTSSVIQNVP